MHRSSRRRRLVLGVSLLALFTAAASTSAQPPADGESAVPVLPPGPDNSLLEALATDASGRVAVLWTRLGQGSAGSVWYRRFGPDDSPLTPPIRLASESSRPTASGLLANGPGDLLISWSTQGADGGSTWFVRRVSANRGIHQWSGRGTVQATALDDSGRIAIVSKRFGRSAWHLVAQRYDARLAPFGPEIELATGATGGPIPGRATAAFQPRTGSLVVVWETLERPTAARLVGRLLHWRRREPDSMVLLATGKGSDPLHPSPFSPAIAWGQGERWAATWTIHPETADAPGSTGIWLATFRGAFEDPIRRRIADTFPDGAAAARTFAP